LPVFEYLLNQLKKLAKPYANVVFNAHKEAPKDYLYINLRNAWVKAKEYYRKLNNSPVYYPATGLHPYYKYYCENS
jgi:S-adenosylmethionine:diacylglycerol 3-amino-3-carboxypropyl transferase